MKAKGPIVSLQAVREAYALTRRGLIERIAGHGFEVMNTGTIRNIEGGYTRPSRELITAWAKALDLDPDAVEFPAPCACREQDAPEETAA